MSTIDGTSEFRTPMRMAMAFGMAALGLIQAYGAASGAEIALRQLIVQQPLKRPVHLVEIPDGSQRLAVVEQIGRVLWFRPGAARAQGVLLDIRDRVSLSANEEGLLSIAFHPDFPQNPNLFVYYSAASPRRSVVSRFTVPAGEVQADANSESVVLEAGQPYGNHNGGQIAFGPDRFLYIGLGDGGAGGDPGGHGQDRSTVLGAILRIDVDRAEEGRAYAIPPGNPFADGPAGSRGEIWAYGLRNPWRFSFDRLNGRLFAGDVGQNAVEEVDVIEKGGNYGWNRMEGTRCYSPRTGCDRSGMRMPVAEYDHSAGISVTGGFVYRGKDIPALRGLYLFGDYGSGRIWGLPGDVNQLARYELLLDTSLLISSFGEDARGELYVLDHRGAVYQIVSAP